MKRLQIYMPEELLENLRLYAQSQGIPLAEALRQAGEEFTSKPVVNKTIRKIAKSQKKRKVDILLEMKGIFKTGPTNASMTVDDIYDD